MSHRSRRIYNIHILYDLIFFDGHRPTGNLPVARRPSPSLSSGFKLVIALYRDIAFCVESLIFSAEYQFCFSKHCAFAAFSHEETIPLCYNVVLYEIVTLQLQTRFKHASKQIHMDLTSKHPTNFHK